MEWILPGAVILIILYFLVRNAVQEGVLNALKEYDASKKSNY